MNEEALGKIENRWLAAPGGPWCVIDYRMSKQPHEPVPVPFTTKRFVEQFLEEGGRLESISVHNKDEASKHGIDEVQWGEMIQDHWMKSLKDHEDALTGTLRGLVTMSRPRYDEATKRSDRSALGVSAKYHGDPVAHIMLKHDTPKELIDFLLHAAVDMGNLIHEIRKLTKKREELAEELAKRSLELAEAKKDAEDSAKLVSQLRKTAEEILRQTS